MRVKQVVYSKTSKLNSFEQTPRGSCGALQERLTNIDLLAGCLALEAKIKWQS